MMGEPDLSTSLPLPRITSRNYGAGLCQAANRLDPFLVGKSLAERRRFPRFQPESKIFILHSTRGTIDDISMGGASYSYYNQAPEDTISSGKQTILLRAGEDTLQDVSCRIIHDTLLRKASSSFPELRQCRIHFTDLNQEQIDALEEFLLRHARVPFTNR